MKNRRLWVSIVAGFLALVMLLGLVFSIIPARANAKSSSEIREEINALESKNEEYEQQIKDLQAQLESNYAEIVDVVNQKCNIEQQINLILDQIKVINSQINAFNRLIADTQDRLDAETVKFQELNNKYKQRIRTMEEEGSLSYWSVLFKANSFADLLDRLNMIQEIAEADTKRIQELSQSAQAIAQSKDELAVQKGEAEVKKEQLSASQSLLVEKRQEAQELIEILLEREAEYEAQQKEIEDSKNNLILEIGRMEAAFAEAWAREEAARQAAIQASIEEEEERRRQEAIENGEEVPETTAPDEEPAPPGGAEGWIVPMAYYTMVTDPYGWRTHPITGEEMSFHSGIDLAAAEGTSIYAARSGVVTTSGYHWSFGNYVVIYHGDGYSTLYAHMVERAVSEGDNVYQGQTIGYVGSTGQSTGDHLHYTIYYNGETVNPAGYL